MAASTSSRLAVAVTDQNEAPTFPAVNIIRVSTEAYGSPSISADGRYVAFASDASNLVPGDTNNAPDVFVRDLQTGSIARVSTDVTGGQGNGVSYAPHISADGRYVAFDSDASNLVPGDTNGTGDVFVRDLQTGAITRVSTDVNGGQGNHQSLNESISADGRYVTFTSLASNLVPGDTDFVPVGTWFGSDVFVRDLWTGAITCISTDANGNPANNSGGGGSSISADGRYLAFESQRTNLVPGDTSIYTGGDVFVRDLQTGAITRVSTDVNGQQGTDFSVNPSMSADGRYVVFYTASSNLVPGDTNNAHDVFVRDMQSGAITRVSTDVNGGQGNGASYAPSISADGRYVAFTSVASNLVPGDTNGTGDIFVRDLQTGAITRVSTDINAAQGVISADGHYVAFFSYEVSYPVYVAAIGSKVVSISENSTAVTTVTATDPDAGQTLSYSIIGGADAGKFTIGSTTGALSFVTAPNFELPTDAGGNNVYDVIVQASDGHGGIDTQAIAVTVNDVFENSAPTITSNGGGNTAALAIVENATAVTTVTATDPDAAQALNYSISGGADASKFTINADTGALLFVTAPNFEAPTDAGRNNVYDVTVQVSDSYGGIDTQALSVSVVGRCHRPVQSGAELADQGHRRL